jgi:hypothetical protein
MEPPIRRRTFLELALASLAATAASGAPPDGRKVTALTIRCSVYRARERAGVLEGA